MSNVTVDPSSAADRGASGPVTQPDLSWVVAGLSAAAGVIHIAMTPIHGGAGLIDPLGFALVGLFQLLVAGAILSGRASRLTYAASIAVNAATLGIWWWSRTYGMPWGSHRGIVESYGVVDVTTAVLEVALIVLCVRLLVAHDHPTEPRRAGRVAPALLAVSALAIAAAVITSPDAANHSHSAPTTPTPEQAITAKRCDKAINIPAYWKEAKYLGVDTIYGGNPPAATATAATASDGHNHSHGAVAAAPVAGATTTTTEPDPTDGRGSATLDRLIGLTSNASGGEGAAAGLVVALGRASQQEYDNWMWWLRASGTVGAGHSHSAASGAVDDTGGHGGHVGPQPWAAMTKQSDCDRLTKELATARKVALTYPTAADAMKAGWHRVTTYVPGIAAHYMNFGLVDDKFQLTKPEMILYDGNGPDAHVVGLSYYLIHDGSLEPTQGFTGANDHGHRHIGLCVGKGGVIGDSTTTVEECAARGGVKDDGSKAWMSHAWVVPGCESPWGVFSAASPVLDRQLGERSGKDSGGCAGSAVRKRYDLGKPVPAPTSKATSGDEGAAAELKGD